MKVAEALEELRTNLLRDDAELASGPNDKLWSDKTLVRYIREAQRTWCRRTLTLRDSHTPSVCEVVLVAGESEYVLHKSIRAVISARYDDRQNDLFRFGHPLLPCPHDDRPFGEAYPSGVPTGAPIAISTDESFDLEHGASVILRVYGTPAAEQTDKILKLRVARMPLCEPDLAKPEADLETPDEYCLQMLKHAAWSALSTSDIDGHDARAENHLSAFNAAVSEVRTANRRKLAQPVRFGFGGSGTVWSR